MPLNSYRFALVAYCFFMVSVFHPYIIFGEIVAPHRQAIEVGAAEMNLNSTYRENRKFSDYNLAYIPEISEHLNGIHSSWLTLWSRKNEMGRPVYNLSGFSPAYFPSWVIAHLTASPWRFITALSLFTCFFSGIFVILFCREIGLNAFAGLIAGTGFGASPLFMYWLTFPMFLAVLCWSAGALWAVTRLAKKSELVGWSVLAFSVYSPSIVC